MLEHTVIVVPHGRVRVTFASQRLHTDPFAIHMEGPAERHERTTTDLLVDVIAFRLDRFVALAFDIPTAMRHERQDAVMDRQMGLVNYLKGGMRYSSEECSKALNIVLPGGLYLLGTPKYEHFTARKCEWEDLSFLAELLAARVANGDKPTCRKCMRPSPCKCVNAKAA